MVSIAKKTGISDRAVAKACARYDIPTPPRGYWRRLQVGEDVEIAELPPGDNRSTSIEVDEAFAVELDQVDIKSGRMKSISAVKARTDSPGVRRKSIGRGKKSLAASNTTAEQVASSSGNVLATALQNWSAEEVFSISQQAYAIQSARMFLGKVAEAVRQSPPGTRAMAALWCERAREWLGANDPLPQLIARLEALALGTDKSGNVERLLGSNPPPDTGFTDLDRNRPRE